MVAIGRLLATLEKTDLAGRLVKIREAEAARIAVADDATLTLEQTIRDMVADGERFGDDTDDDTHGGGGGSPPGGAPGVPGDAGPSVGDDPNLPGEMITTVTLKKVSCGTEVNVVQEGIPEAIPLEMCYLGWQESMLQLATLVEPEIPG